MTLGKTILIIKKVLSTAPSKMTLSKMKQPNDTWHFDT